MIASRIRGFVWLSAAPNLDNHLVKSTGGLPMNAVASSTIPPSGRILTRMMLWFVVLHVALLILSFFGVFPWSGLNCSQLDVDILSGRIRHTQYLFWLPVDRSVEDSVLTKALPAGGLTGLSAEWHPVNNLSPTNGTRNSLMPLPAGPYAPDAVVPSGTAGASAGVCWPGARTGRIGHRPRGMRSP